MPRKSRQSFLFNGCFAHIMARTFESQNIFENNQDFCVFEFMLLKKKQEFGFLVHHYCLMNNHYHLLVKIPNLVEFSLAFKGLQRKYTEYHHKKYKREGPLWRERFTSKLIQDEQYLYSCGIYIEYNPVKANLVKSPEDWLYSSSRFYVKNEANRLVDTYR